ncbi:MAG: hydrogenase maturation nickel metallochaperone HypA [Vulcanimicrobiaceae bacterium]
MHELSVALSLLEEVDAVAAREGATSVASVRLRLGAMSGIVRDALAFSWDLARVDTVAVDARLDIEDVPVIVWCPQCRAERDVRAGAGLTCAACGTIAPTILRGREVELVAVEVS